MFPSDRAPLPGGPDKATHLRGGWRRGRGPQGLREERTGGERDPSDHPCCLHRLDPALGTSLAPHSLPWGRPGPEVGAWESRPLAQAWRTVGPQGQSGARLGGEGRETLRTESSGRIASPEAERARFPNANTSTCPDPGTGVPALRSLLPQDPGSEPSTLSCCEARAAALSKS